MKLLFVKGKRGLAANHNGKFYFPDRNGCIKATGLYDCKITIDKDKFAFVDGKLIKTQATSIETICSLLNLDMSSVGLENRETINVFNVNNVDVLFVKNSISTHLIYINDKEQIESITSFSTNSKSSYNLRQLYSPGENMKRIISNMDIKNYLVKNGAETLSDLMLLKAATIVKSKQGKYHHIIDMSLVDSKFIVVHTEYWDVNLTGIYVYDKKQNALIDVDEKIFDAVADKKNCKKISVKEIDEFCIKNHIAMHYLKCSDCDVISTNETDEKEEDEPLGHSFTDKPSNVQAATGTCGSNTYYVQCDRCDAVSDTKTVVVGEATNHLNTVVINQKDATCTKPGYTGDTVCDQCGALIKKGEEIPATGHKTSNKVSDKIAKEATCTTPAKYYLLCDTCNEVTEDTKEVGKPNGHSFTNKDSGKVKDEATCTSPAIHYVQCDNCDEISTDKTIEIGSTDAENHGNIVLKNDKKATCKDEGYTGDEYCEDCGKLVKTGTKIPVTNEHTWDAGKVTKAATCTQAGEKTYTCSVCGATKKEIIKKTEHEWAPRTETKVSGKDVVTTTKKTYDQCSVCKSVRNMKTVNSVRIKTPSVTLKAGKKSFTAKTKKLSGINGYQIRYSVKKNMKKSKTVTTKKTSKTVKKLISKKKYYVQVRAYKTVNGKKVFSSWSKVKNITTKK